MSVMSVMSVKHTFEQIQLSDSYTRSIVFGYIRDISHNFVFTIPSIIYELCVSFYYAGEHFAYLGYDMYITSENDNKSLRTYNNIIEMTSDNEWNTCYGQVIVDTKLKIDYIYEWVFQINTTYATSIGFGLSTEYDKTDDAFWINTTKINPNAKYYSFTASINAFEKLSLLSSNSSEWITYNQSLSNHDRIKLIFNVKKKTLQCIINDIINDNIMVHNIIYHHAKYHLSISMCGRYHIRLLDFKRKIHRNLPHNYTSSYNIIFAIGNIEIGILSKSISQYYNYNYNYNDNAYDSDNDDHEEIKEGDILTLKKILNDYQAIKSKSCRKQIILDFANKKIKITQFKAIEEVYGLIELIILLVIRNRYKDNVIFTQSYFKDVSQFVEWIFYDENNMDSSSWPIKQFAQSFDDWIEKIIN